MLQNFVHRQNLPVMTCPCLSCRTITPCSKGAIRCPWFVDEWMLRAVRLVIHVTLKSDITHQPCLLLLGESWISPKCWWKMVNPKMLNPFTLARKVHLLIAEDDQTSLWTLDFRLRGWWGDLFQQQLQVSWPCLVVTVVCQGRGPLLGLQTEISWFGFSDHCSIILTSTMIKGCQVQRVAGARGLSISHKAQVSHSWGWVQQIHSRCHGGTSRHGWILLLQWLWSQDVQI